MADFYANELPSAMVGETNHFAVSFVPVLDSGETLTGTPTITEIDTSDLTISNKAVSTAALTILGKSVPTAKAVQFTVVGQLKASSPYAIKISVGTSDSQTKVRGVKFRVEDEDGAGNAS